MISQEKLTIIRTNLILFFLKGKDPELTKSQWSTYFEMDQRKFIVLNFSKDLPEFYNDSVNHYFEIFKKGNKYTFLLQEASGELREAFKKQALEDMEG